MWDILIYGLVLVNVMVLVLLMVREIKRSREYAGAPVLRLSAANTPAGGSTAHLLEQLNLASPLILDGHGEVRCPTERPLPATGNLVVSLLFLVMGAAILVWGFHLTNQGFVSRSWPSTPGKIVSSTVVETWESSSNRPLYHAEVQYTYAVKSVTYANDKVSFTSTSSPDRMSAFCIATRYLIGKVVPVSYNPAQPKNAVLEPGVKPSFLLLFAIGAVFIITSLLFILLSGRRKLNKRLHF